MSASRNLGLREANGHYIAFLDADDVWLPAKLERQVALLDARPDVAMTYGATLYWHSWDTTSAEPDYLIAPGVASAEVFDAPKLLTHFLERKMNMPCMGSMLIRREAVLAFGGWEDEFTGLFEDQVFFSKLCVGNGVLATNDCWDKYRQHENSSCSIGARSGELVQARARFHDWLARYLTKLGLRESAAWQAYEREVVRSSIVVA
jgi:glycosyltransferase involved in cell wall biosynthesis